jgi:8-oxo-dGTP pyrophosphatase MutT (NUDIX family)
VSVKGVVYDSDRVLLALNDRDEWELPGGQLEAGETPQECVEREILEETGLQVTAGPIIMSWVFEVIAGTHVVVIAYGCTPRSATTALAVSAEHTDVAFVPPDILAGISLPAGYRQAIAAWPP